MLIYPSIAALKKADHESIQAVVPVLESLPSGFTMTRLCDLIDQNKIWKDLDTVQVASRCRRVMEHLTAIGYVVADTGTHGWYAPDLRVIARDREAIFKEVEREKASWALGSQHQLAALQGAPSTSGRGHAGGKASGKLRGLVDGAKGKSKK